MGLLPASASEADSSFFAQSIIENWIQHQVLAKKASDLGLANSQEFEQRYTQLKTQLLSELLLDYVSVNQTEITVSRDEVMQYYNQHRSSIVLPERHLQFHHMITETLEDAEQARSEIFMGLDWEEIALRYSVDPEYSISNSRIFHAESNVLEDFPPLQVFARRMGITEVSPNRIINDNYHFIQLVDDRAEGDIPDLEWALYLIEEWLLNDKKKQFLDSYKRSLVREAKNSNLVEIF